jgi:hypothetical protein
MQLRHDIMLVFTSAISQLKLVLTAPVGTAIACSAITHTEEVK